MSCACALLQHFACFAESIVLLPGVTLHALGLVVYLVEDTDKDNGR